MSSNYKESNNIRVLSRIVCPVELGKLGSEVVLKKLFDFVRIRNHVQLCQADSNRIHQVTQVM